MVRSDPAWAPMATWRCGREKAALRLLAGGARPRLAFPAKRSSTMRVSDVLARQPSGPVRRPLIWGEIVGLAGEKEGTRDRPATPRQGDEMSALLLSSHEVGMIRPSCRSCRKIAGDLRPVVWICTCSTWFCVRSGLKLDLDCNRCTHVI
jgi:hypothetical protein